MTTKCPACEKLKWRRSRPAHGMLFAVIEQAFQNWPESHPAFIPRNKEHLRYWLTKEAGDEFYDVPLTIKPDEMPAERIAWLLQAVLYKSDSERMFVEVDENGDVVCKVTKSIAWSKMGQDDFNKLSSAIYEQLSLLGLHHDRIEVA
jgi:hypothetical protein